MLFVPPEEVSLSIEEICTGSTASDKWRVDIRVTGRDEQHYRKQREISDPLKPSDRSRLKSYLNETLDMSFTPNHSKIEEKLNSYPGILAKGLDLDAYSTHLNGRKVNIWIRGTQSTTETSCGKSIHSLHWELLEDLSRWGSDKHGLTAKPISITVRRSVGNPDSCAVQRDGTQEVQSSKPELFNVLLVVARTKVHEAETDYFNPTSILRAILEAQAELESRSSQKSIHLEVVRPGSYDELETHLQQSRQSGKTFQIVHFDLHGDIDSTIGAHLIFNRYADISHHLVEDKVPAKVIAELLHDHGIRCAVLSSCKTAVADAGIEANLSWSFLHHGMASVLAISYNIPDTMSKIFFPRFYHEIFINRCEFADAAAIARRELCIRPGRWSYTLGDSVDLQDWFIPKVYSDGEPRYIGRKLNLYLSIRIGIKKPIPQILIITIGLALVFILNPLTWSPLVNILATVINVNGSDSIMWARLCLSAPFMMLLVALYNRLRTKWQSVQRLDLIDRDRKNILRVEGDLRQSHQILLHTVNDQKNTAHTLLDSLSHVWCRTHLVQHRVMIKAEWFLQPFPWDNTGDWDWSCLPRSIGHILQLWRQGFSPGLSQLSRRRGREPKTVVVVANIKALFPGENLEQSYHQNAQIRFRDWLERYFGFEGEAGGEVWGDRGEHQSRLPYYLVLIEEGWGVGAQSWFREYIGGLKALERLIVTEYTNPENFEHNLERPLTSQSNY